MNRDNTADISEEASSYQSLSGMYILLFFAVIWGVLAIHAFHIFQTGILLLLLITLALILINIRFSKNIKFHYFEKTNYKLHPKSKKKLRKIILTEFILILLLIFLAPQIGLRKFFLPLIALIIGWHFLPMARIWKIRIYSYTGLSIIGWAFVWLLTGFTALSANQRLGIMEAGISFSLYTCLLFMMLSIHAKINSRNMKVRKKLE